MSKSSTYQRIAQISAVLREIRPPAPPLAEPTEYNKKCGKCGAYLPRLPKYWTRSYKRGKVYMSSPCHVCRKKYSRSAHSQSQVTAANTRRKAQAQRLVEQRRQTAERNRQIVEEFRKSIE